MMLSLIGHGASRHAGMPRRGASFGFVMEFGRTTAELESGEGGRGLCSSTEPTLSGELELELEPEQPMPVPEPAPVPAPALVPAQERSVQAEPAPCEEQTAPTPSKDQLAASEEPAPLRLIQYEADERFVLVRLALGVSAANAQSCSCSLVADWRTRVVNELLPSTFLLLSAEVRWHSASPNARRGTLSTPPRGASHCIPASSPAASAASRLALPTGGSGGGVTPSTQTTVTATASRDSSSEQPHAADPDPPLLERGSLGDDDSGPAPHIVQQPQQDLAVLLEVMCKLDIDSACEGGGGGGRRQGGECWGEEEEADGLRRALLQRLCGGSTALPRRVAAALCGAEPDPDADDGLVVTVQAEDLLFLEYTYSGSSRAWLPLHCMPTDPLCLPPPPPLGVGGGRYCAIQVSLRPGVVLLGPRHPAPAPAPAYTAEPVSAVAAAALLDGRAGQQGAGAAAAVGMSVPVAVVIEERRSPLLEVWPEEFLRAEPERLEAHLYGSNRAFASVLIGTAPSTASVMSGVAAGADGRSPVVSVTRQPQQISAAGPPRRRLSEPGFDPDSPSSVRLIRRVGSVTVTLPYGEADAEPYVGLLVVEVWRGGVLCGVGHASVAERSATNGVGCGGFAPGSYAGLLAAPEVWAAEAAALAASTPSSPPALTPASGEPSPPLGHLRSLSRCPYGGGSGPGSDDGSGGDEGGNRFGGSTSDDSREVGAEGLEEPVAGSSSIAQDPRNLLLQDLGLFMVYAYAQRSDSLADWFKRLHMRSRLLLHESLLRAGCRVADAAAEGGHACLAAALRAALRSLGCADRELLSGGVKRPAGLPLLHLALLSCRREMVSAVVQWCLEASCGAKSWLKPVTVVLPPHLAPAFLAALAAAGGEVPPAVHTAVPYEPFMSAPLAPNGQASKGQPDGGRGGYGGWDEGADLVEGSEYVSVTVEPVRLAAAQGLLDVIAPLAPPPMHMPMPMPVPAGLMHMPAGGFGPAGMGSEREGWARPA
ncbi:hypothetical protein HYH03_007349 [Edaphochlamys debaryana]|uniref:Uncharacterized protein n=1 Tax=Edaphochlamys debaryana TaxID=47281 RepID=A0A835Y279_9CHLO|nr:hypothetical protein HYH03_007349 [Edaphochlamys debaryana]|eukprot:KAG2494583.1 hypothetical protein HYH03_007349 [Edaphochlamys debaryana]